MNNSGDSGSEEIRRVIAERADGDSDESLIAAHPHLAPELEQELRKRRLIQAARDQAAKPGSFVDAPTEGFDGADHPLPAGIQVKYFGDYQILDRIAEGGMGIVYKARQMTLNRTVALKMIRSGEFAEEEEKQRFYAEAEAAANLDHPNIVPIYEIGEHQGQYYFSMAYVEGSSLAELIRAHPLPGKNAARYVKILAEAIEYAHKHGILHRDIKPSNVLVSVSDEPRVTDFGLAKQINRDSDLTASGQVLGTPSFMPPEQAMGDQKNIGRQSDVYSLGALLYALITGRPPFQADTAVGTIMQVIEGEPVAPRQLNPEIDRDLETICLKCLQKEPDRRYASCQDLADDLVRYQRGEPIKARPISGPAKAWRWFKRNPVVAGLTAATLLILLIGIVTTSYFAVSSSRYAHGLEQEIKRSQMASNAILWDSAVRSFRDNDILGAERLLGQVSLEYQK